jgi:hypothetical protein
MEHLFHPWHYAEILPAIPIIGAWLGAIITTARASLGMKADHEDEDHHPQAGEGTG